MVRTRPVIPITIALTIAAVYFFFKPDDIQYQPEQIIQLPDDSPDAYMTNVDITRYNTDGSVALKTISDSIATYEDNQISKFNKPIVTLFEQGIPTWEIISDTAVTNAGNIIEFHQNVVATQLTNTPTLTLVTEFLSVNNQQQTIETHLPVQLTRANQKIDAIGMDAKMDTIGSTIHFQSEVSFIYEP